jgi:threonine synthase
MQESSSFIGIVCVECRTEQPVTSPSPVCRRCGGRLEVVLDLEAAREKVTKRSIRESKSRGVWKYRELLPIMNPRGIVSLGEGNTNLMRSESLAQVLGMRRLYIKDETSNPSGSFLDRGTTVEISRAKALAYRVVACGWSGNLASSSAAYCARGGLHSLAYMPSQIDLGKLYQIVAYGAEIIPCASRESASRKVSERMDDHYPLTPSNAFFLEGIKTSGIEVADQMDWKLPDWIIVPMGNGSHLAMIRKGLKDLELLGVVEKASTRLLGVQVEGFSPIADRIKSRGAKSKSGDSTFARDIAVRDPGMADEAIEAIRSSGGDALVVSEKEILDAVKSLASNEGIFAEPAAASTVAAIRGALESGMIGRSETVVCMITGMGLKDPAMARKLASRNRAARNIITRFEEMPFTRRIGDSKLAILRIIQESESYAYGIRKQLSDQGRSMSLVSVYQHLSELEELGLVVVERRDRTAERRVRVYYSLTARGQDVLSSLSEAAV